MDLAIPIADNTYWIGVNDRHTDLFEGLWPLPRGVSYNSYFIKDEKTTVIDTVKNSRTNNYVDKIRSLIGREGKVDYLVINHMEPDHSGAIRVLRNIYPDMQIIANVKTLDFLKHFYEITENVRIVADGDEIDLGGRKLKFTLTPMVHWPETMMTYDTKTGVLFTGDAFGGFGSLNGGIFDDEVDVEYFEGEILRYFSNIVAKYSVMVQKAIKKVGGLDIKIIASTHGPVWRSNPQFIIDKYLKWSRQEAEEGVVIVFGSMYGNTERMMEATAKGLTGEDVSKIRIHDISRGHVSYIIRDIWKYKALVLGACTYNMKLFPPMEYLVNFLENDKLKNRVLGIIGTYGWSGGGVKRLKEFAEKVKWDLVEPVVEARCAPTEEDLDKCVKLGGNIVEALNKCNTCLSI